MSEDDPIEGPDKHPSSRILPGRRTPAHFVLCLMLVLAVVTAAVVLLMIYGPAFTSHPPGALQSDRPQASGSRLQ